MPSQGIALLFSTRQTSVLTRLESARAVLLCPPGLVDAVRTGVSGN